MVTEETPITSENFLLYAAKEYSNPHCLGVSEFNDDLKKFMYVKRLLKRHQRGVDFKFRMLVNHIVVINNLFRSEATNRMLYFYCDKTTWPIIKAILMYLNISHENVPELQGLKIKPDPTVIKTLEEL